MIESLKLFALPGSISAIVAAIVVGALLSYVKPRLARVWLTVVAASYWLLSCPLGADALAWTLDPGVAPLMRASDARDASAIVVLSAGSVNVRVGDLQLPQLTAAGALRAAETARLFLLLGGPLVVVAGGANDPQPGALTEAAAYRAALVSFGVPADRIVEETQSRNTREEALAVGPFLRNRGIDRFVLVTSPWHMRRARAAFATAGLHPVASPSALYSDRSHPPSIIVPNDAAFAVGNAAVYEWLARAYYWWRGWTQVPA